MCFFSHFSSDSEEEMKRSPEEVANKPLEVVVDDDGGGGGGGVDCMFSHKTLLVGFDIVRLLLHWFSFMFAMVGFHQVIL